jgi:hypothetical protein
MRLHGDTLRTVLALAADRIGSAAEPPLGTILV